MDSQLLTLSSIFTRDIVPLIRRRAIEWPAAGRIFVIMLSLIGLALAYKPPATIIQIATQTFTGLAVLFPTVLFGLYRNEPKPLPAIFSIVAGEIAVILYFFNLLPRGGFLPAVPVVMVAFAAYLLTHGVMAWGSGELQIKKPLWISNPFVYMMAAIFLLSMDFWAWGKIHPSFAGVPFWWIYFVILSGLQTAVMMRMVRKK